MERLIDVQYLSDYTLQSLIEALHEDVSEGSFRALELLLIAQMEMRARTDRGGDRNDH